jgi:hypothetical protein
MNVKVLGLVALLSALLVWSPANAATYTYSVDYLIGPDTVTGSITTTCNSCTLTGTDVTAWSFSVPALSLAISGTAPTALGGDLTASPTAIVWTPSGSPSIFGSLLQGGCIDFDAQACAAVVPFNFDAVSPTNPIVSGIAFTPLTIATATPLPAALPLFGSVVGVVGLLCRRRRRSVMAGAIATT